MQLSELLKDWPCIVKGSVRVQIEGIEDFSKQVKKNDLYVVRKGRKFNGEDFVHEAVTNGASAIVVDQESFLQWELPVPIIWVPNCARFLAFASAKFYRFPSDALTFIAITGTNGKTTVSHFIHQLLQVQNRSSLLIGTNGIFLNNERWIFEYESLTTPQAKDLQRIFHEAIQQSIEYVVIEASSAGLEQHRLDYCSIDLGVFLNLSAEHIEDHGSFKRYQRAKERLATLAKKIVLNGEDAFCRSVGFMSTKPKNVFSTAEPCDLQWGILSKEADCSICYIQMKDEKHVIEIPFPEYFQLQNVMAAVTVLLQLGFPTNSIFPHLMALRLPEGRMQEIQNHLDIRIIIDFAHTPIALQAVLKDIDSERLVVVFSCGGERDQQKRKKMGEIASRYAHCIYLTTDNARSELPQTINAQIKEGFSSNQLYEEILNREEAIEQAIRQANQGDTIVIAGKGHERTQTIGGNTYEFSDVDTVLAVLKKIENEANT